MMRAVVMMLVFVLCAAGCAAPQGKTRALQPAVAPVTPVDQGGSVWDFGTIARDLAVKHTFVFTNRTARTLTIKDVTTSCGCTVSDVTLKTLAQGQSTQINVSFDSTGYSGQTVQFVYVTTDDPDEPLLKFVIKATVR